MRGEPYYVQRCRQNPDATAGGQWFDAILEFDYMGSSEFEGNWQFRSLKHIRENMKHYHEIHIQYMGSDAIVNVFIDKRIEKNYREHLLKLSEGKTRLFEYCDFHDAIEGDKPRNDFWWDLDNHVMFWIDKSDKFNKEFAKKIQPQTELVIATESSWFGLLRKWIKK